MFSSLDCGQFSVERHHVTLQTKKLSDQHKAGGMFLDGYLMYLLDKLRVVLHEEGDGLHQLRLSERCDLAGGGRRHSVVHQTGGRALSWSAAGESLERGEGLQL